MTEFIIVNIGYGFAFIALAIKEVLWLRVILTVSFMFRLFYSYSITGNNNVAFWNSLFILVNIIMIVKIIDERRSRFIPHEIKDIKNTIFKQLTSKEFLYLWSLGKIRTMEKETIIDKGVKQKKLMFLLSGKSFVKGGSKILAELERGQFIAEMSFLTNQPTSAQVVTEEEVTIIEWDNDILKRIENTNQSFWQKIHYILSKDVTKKLELMNKAHQG
ncbi:MAG: hypothetical protein CMG64_01410 [Candidatus Marinimicrobia bacterium]|nr:hypothetical protein [Candidatus Neomarinimicrobiota bacterium]|tara:strand:+ start:988 stop:1638 length:651 start_codon:yes stop_codon:yes gene_type:complete